MIKDGLSFNPGSIVELYKFDFMTASAIPAGWPEDRKVLYCSPHNDHGSNIVYGGISYQYMPMRIDAIVIESGGKMPEPSLRLTDASSVDSANGWFFRFFNDGGDFRGIQVTRIRVFAHSLDNGSAPSQSATVKKEQVFYINQMASKERREITFKLSPALGLDSLNDKANRQLSSTQCNLKYRYWNAQTNQFVYTTVKDGGCPWGQAGENAMYPYVPGSDWGTKYFDVNDQPTTEPGADKCSLTIGGCLKRFPVTTADQEFPITINLQGKTKFPTPGK